MSPRRVSPLDLLRDRLVAADPGGAKGRFSLRVTLTLALALAAEAGIAVLVGQPLTAFVIGAIVAMLSAVAVRDPSPADQAVTVLVVPLGAAVPITTAAFSNASPVASAALFVVAMFVAVWMRRFGPRWDAVGMAVFMAYFFATYVGATPAQLPWMLLSLTIGTAASLLVRFVLVRDRPPDLRRILPALRAQVRLVLHDLGRIVRGPRSPRDHRLIAKRVMELNEVVLMLREHEDEEARRALFEAELAVQRLDDLAGRERSPAEREAILHDLRALYHAPASPEGRAIAWRTDPDTRFGSALRRLVDALDAASRHRVRHAAAGAATGGDAAAWRRGSEPPAGSADSVAGTGGDSGPRGGLLPTTRTAIQTAAAGVLAIVGGQLLEPGQWHWAVITAFLVFTGTNSRGAVLVKGWRRVLGTLTGVVGGIGLVVLIPDSRALSLALILLSIFAGFYLIRSSYAGMMFWITVMIALLYDLMGRPGLAMLQVRAEETLLGATVGALIAAFLLPTRTKPIVEDEGRELLRALGDVIDGARRRLEGHDTEAELLVRMRDMDQAFQSLREVGEPLAFRPPGAPPRTSERWLVVLPLLVYEAHALVFRANRAAAEGAGAAHLDLADAWRQATERLQERIEPLAEAIGSGRASSLTEATVERAARAPWPGEGPPGPYRVPEDAGPTAAALARSLARLDWVVTVLAEGVDAGGPRPGHDATPAAGDATRSPGTVGERR